VVQLQVKLQEISNTVQRLETFNL